jgi:YebC/PmpR family DNA-binding regulatory protein
MSGHNKWSKIKHKKAATDSRKSNVFGKLVRLIQVEAKKANGNTESTGLRLAIEKARQENMPKENIDRAIKKAGELSSDPQPMMYEGYGPGGVGIIVTALTDNTNRTSPEIRHTFDKLGGSMGTPGSVSWNFIKNSETGDWEPQTTLEVSDEDLEKLSSLVDALEEHDDVQDVFTNAE